MSWWIMGTDHLFDPNRARHSALAHPPSKTIARPPDTCRIIVTLEVQVSQDMMKAARMQHLYEATDVMRACLKPYSTIGAAAEVLDEMRHDGEIQVLSTKIEGNK